MKFNLELNTNSVKNIIDSLKFTQENINKLISKALKDLAEKGISYIYENLSLYGLGGTSIPDTVRMVKVSDTHYRLVATGKQFNNGLCQAVLMEFGTGVKGQEQPHPEAGQEGYSYNVNNHDKGWWYPTTEYDSNWTKKVLENGDMIAFTRGLPSRPFMYKTREQLSIEIESVLRTYIRELM